MKMLENVIYKGLKYGDTSTEELVWTYSNESMNQGSEYENKDQIW